MARAAGAVSGGLGVTAADLLPGSPPGFTTGSPKKGSSICAFQQDSSPSQRQAQPLQPRRHQQTEPLVRAASNGRTRPGAVAKNVRRHESSRHSLRAKPSGKDLGMVQWLAAQAERRANERSPVIHAAAEDAASSPCARRGEAGGGAAAAAAAAAVAAASQAAAAAASQQRMLLPVRPRSPQSSSLMDMAATVAAMSAAANAAAASAAMIRELRLAQECKARQPFEGLGSIHNDGSPAATGCSWTSPPLVQGTKSAPALEEIQISTPNTSPIGSFSVPTTESVSRVAALSLAFQRSQHQLHVKVDSQNEHESEDAEGELQDLRAGISDLECFIVEEERRGRCSDRARFALDLAVRGLTALESCADFLANADSEEC